MYSNECLTLNSNELSMKKSVKWLELPIQKFNAVVPHLVDILKNHQNNITKLKRLNQWDDIKKEHTSARRTVNQLTSLLSEMENLRNQVVKSDLDKFDKLISNSKQSALSTIQSYQDIPVQPQPSYKFEDQDSNSSESGQFQDQKLLVIADISEVIKEQEKKALAMERLQEDIKDVNFVFQELSQYVHDQGEAVGKIEENVETAHHNVVEGERMLCQAAKYKNGMYPLIGALVGSVVGGPVGLLAGFKLGGLTAVGCGFLGFTGGRILKNQNEVTITQAERYREDLKN